jgi:hypothetical protein
MDGSQRHDPFIDKFFARIPRDAAESFTPAQLAAIRMAFGARSWGSHALDIRKSFPLFWRRVYLVLLIGTERRTADRLRAEGELFGTFGNAIVTLMFVALLLLPLMAGLYLLKWSAGIDLVPGGGAHGFWDGVAAQLRQLGR